MDKIFLSGYTVEAIIGLWDWERKLPQKILIDLELGTDTRAAGASDNIDDTLNYKEVADRIAEIAKDGKFLLVEALAEAIADYVLKQPAIVWTSVRISKPGAIKGSKYVGVQIERSAP